MPPEQTHNRHGSDDSASPAANADLDATGLLCPLPVLKARKRLAALEKGQVLRMIADDPAALVDVPHFCAEQGHELLEQSETESGALLFLLRKG